MCRRLVIMACLSLGLFTSSSADEVKLRFGDAELRPFVELSRMQLAGGRYQVGLEDGRTAVLSIDPALQARAQTVLAEASPPEGSIVVMALDGRVLAAVGRATSSERSLEEILGTPWAPAASIFKIVTAAALIDAGVEPHTPVCYHGGLRSVEARNLIDDPRLDTACHDLTYGVAKSQNAIMGKLAARHLDATALRRAAQAFGFGRAPDFAVPMEPAAASIPDEPLERARVAAGFVRTTLSPLGGALLGLVVATGGLEITPRLVDSVIGRDGIERPVLPRTPHRVLGAETARAVAATMVETTRRGTAYAAFHDRRGTPYLGEIAVAGKTGSLSRGEINYSWFVGFAPADAPQYVVSVVLGNAPAWRVKAHTAARMVLETALDAR